MTCPHCAMPTTEEGYQSHNCFQYLKERNRELEEALAVATEEMAAQHLQIEKLTKEKHQWMP